MIQKKLLIILITPLMLFLNITANAFHNWEPPVNLNNGTTISIQFAKIVCDPIGNGAAIWYDTSNNGQAGVSFRPVNGIWEAPTYFPTNGQKNSVDITMDELGNVTAFYTDGTGLNTLYAVYRPAGLPGNLLHPAAQRSGHLWGAALRPPLTGFF